MTGWTLQDGQAGLPTPDSTRSFWHREPSEALLGHRTTAQLPATADVVVVGSGMTGAFAARELVAGGRTVVMLEAREACWGATGRNGGHCWPALGSGSAAVARFELATLGMLDALVAAHGIECDWRVVGGVHALRTAAEVAAARRALARLERHADLRGRARLEVGAAELAALRVPGAAGAVVQAEAATCWPYKLVAWVLEQLVGGRRFNLQTATPATGLARAGGAWMVRTPRGVVAAAHVVLAANAHTSFLAPGMARLIVPVRGQVCALRPPADAAPLAHSYVWLPAGGAGADDYLVGRADGVDGPLLVLGGERRGGGAGEWRDDALDAAVGRRLRHALAGAVKLRPGAAPEAPALDAAYEWTGIMGFSRDGHPWVGRLPAALAGLGADADGLWISAGYTGHGMPVAARCGVAVARMVLGRDDVALPAEYAVSAARAARAGGLALPSGRWW